MTKVAYWLIIFFVTCGVFGSVTLWRANNISEELGIDKEVIKTVHEPKGINKLFGETIIEFESGNILRSRPVSWESVLCFPGVLFVLSAPATLLVYRKDLKKKLQSNMNKMIFALICSICFTSLAILVKLCLNSGDL